VSQRRLGVVMSDAARFYHAIRFYFYCPLYYIFWFVDACFTGKS